MEKRKNALRTLGLWGLLTVLFSSVSCIQAPGSVLRIATNVWPGYEPLYLARGLGLYDESSLHLVEMPSASQALHALRNGIVEGAALTLDEALHLMQDKTIDLRVILVMDVSNGADVLLAREEISTLKDLRGKRVGVENTATGAVVLDAALERAGLNAKDVMILPTTVNDHVAVWQNHEVDALVTFEPVRSTLLNAGAHELFNTREIPGRILDVLVVRADAIEEHRAALKTLISGYFAAVRYIKNHPEDAAQRLSPRLKTHPRQVMSLFKGLDLPDLEANRKWLSGSNPTLKHAASSLADLMRQHHLLQFDINVDSLAEPGFLPVSIDESDQHS